MADEVLPRETGVEKAGVCKTHGVDIPAVKTSYGSTVPGACPECSGGDPLDAQTAAAEESEEGEKPASRKRRRR